MAHEKKFGWSSRKPRLLTPLAPLLLRGAVMIQGLAAIARPFLFVLLNGGLDGI